jgi:hypothetical protein
VCFIFLLLSKHILAVLRSWWWKKGTTRAEEEAAEREGGPPQRQPQPYTGFTVLQALGYPPDVRIIRVPDGRLGLAVRPAAERESGRGQRQQQGGGVVEGIPTGWLRIDHVVGVNLPDELEAGDVIIRVNALPLDSFDFATALRILTLATHRHLTVVKHQVQPYLITYIPTQLPTYIPTCLHIHKHTYIHTHIQT